MPLFGESLNKLVKRCKDAKIEYREEDENEEYEAFITVLLQGGKKKRHILLADESDIDDLLNIKFEDYSFIDRYDAIYSPAKKTIEACIHPLRGLRSIIYRSILNYRKFGKNFDRKNLPDLVLKDTTDSDRTITIGPCTKEFEILTQNKPVRSQKFPYATIRLQGFKVDQHKAAKLILERIAQSIFFQLDLKYKIPLNLSIYSNAPPRIGLGFQGKVELDYPKREFDEDALALYWYAKSARKMPLQKFLAYYQILEFHFPNFTKIAACKKIKNLLIDPSFNIDKEKDLNRILAVLESNSPNITNERSQLYSTLEACVDIFELKDFFKPKKRHDFFVKKNKELTEVTIPLDDKKADIIKSVTSRIYDIRCKIVHTKDLTGSTKPLLPNSQGVENLSEDIKLLEFIAKKVIIASSVPLNI